MVPSNLVRRRKRADTSLQDIERNPPSEVPLPPPLATEDVRMSPVTGSASTIVDQAHRTDANAFGLTREYHRKPPRAPDDFPIEPAGLPQPTTIDIINPYPNISAFRLAHINAVFPKKSQAYEDAIQELLLREDFDRFDLSGVNLEVMKKKVLDKSVPWGNLDEGWRESPVTIGIPDSDKSKKGKGRQRTEDDIEGEKYTVNGFWFRPIIPLIKSILTSNESRTFHYEPYRQEWQRPGSSDPPVRIYDEMFTADAWLAEHENIQNIELPPDEPDDYPRAIASLMFWSDSTHLAEFGEASAWPIYMAFANQSKYERSKPGAHALHHIGFLPSVSFIVCCRFPSQSLTIGYS